MRAVVQRVVRASVSVGGAQHSSIGKGLCVLLGVGKGDTDADTEWIVKKLLSLRLWPSAAGKEWAENVEGIGGEFLVVSQFTLFAKVSKGAKPDFHNAMPGPSSRLVYEDVLRRLREGFKAESVKDCVFGAMMEASQGPHPTSPQISVSCMLRNRTACVLLLIMAPHRSHAQLPVVLASVSSLPWSVSRYDKCDHVSVVGAE